MDNISSFPTYLLRILRQVQDVTRCLLNVYAYSAIVSHLFDSLRPDGLSLSNDG